MLAAKQRGNELARAGAWGEVLAEYVQAIELAESEEQEPESRETLGALHANASLSHLKLGGGAHALAHAEAASEFRPGWAKGHARRAEALVAMGRILDAAAVYVLAMRLEPSSREYKRSHDALCTRVSLLRAAAAAPRSREEIQTLQLPVDHDYEDDDHEYGGGGGDDSDDEDFDKDDAPRPGPPERAQASDPNGRYEPRRLEELSLLALFRTGQVLPAGSVATTVQQEQLLRRAVIDGAIAAAGPGMDVCHGTRVWLLRKALELGLDLEAQLTHGERAESVTARGKALMTSEYELRISVDPAESTVRYEHLSRNEWSYGTVLVDATYMCGLESWFLVPSRSDGHFGSGSVEHARWRVDRSGAPAHMERVTRSIGGCLEESAAKTLSQYYCISAGRQLGPKRMPSMKTFSGYDPNI